MISTKVMKAQFGKTVSGQTWFHINKEMVWKVCVRNQNTTFWSYAESNLFYLCLSFTSTCLKFLSFIQTADTPAHHHNSLIFFSVTRREKSWTNFQNSTIFVLFLWCDRDCVSRSCICSLHERNGAQLVSLDVSEAFYRIQWAIHSAGSIYMWSHEYALCRIAQLHTDITTA